MSATVNALDAFLNSYGYVAIFAAMVAEQFIPPMPGEPLLLGAGALADTGDFHLSWAAALALMGTIVGDVLWYEIGRRGGHRVLGRLCRLSIEPDSCVRRSEDAFARRGASALLLAKFLPGLNSLGQPLAGALRMPRSRFLVFDILGAVLWVGLYIGLGYAFRNQLADVAAVVERLGGWALIALAGVFGLWLGIKVVRRQRFLRQLRIARISPEDLKRMLDAGEPVFIVDLRHELDVQAEPMGIPGSVHLVPGALEKAPGALPRDREVVLYCT